MIILFFIVALLYSMVGFGGGSSYIALLILFELPYSITPTIALLCNLIVVSGGTFHFVRAGHFSRKLTLPFIITSMPAAYLCGSLHVEKRLFLIILSVALFLAGVKILMFQNRMGREGKEEYQDPGKIKGIRPCGFFLGALLGGISGLVGIGGGIFLAPLLHLLGWGRPKQIAATASVFILVNSLAGVIGQLTKHESLRLLLHHQGLLAGLFIAVLVGGQIGSILGSQRVSQHVVRYLTALLVLFVSLRIVFQVF